MSAVAVAPPPEGQELSLFDEPDEPTLDAVLSGLWREVERAHAVTCPLCGGEMRPERAAGREAVARCESCETLLG